MSGLTSLVQAGGVLEKKIETVANNLANARTVDSKKTNLHLEKYFPLCNVWFLNQKKSIFFPTNT